MPANLYAEGAPVLLTAGALLKDNQTGMVLAQLKFQNIGAKVVKAVKTEITPQDVMGNQLGASADYQYLDLNAARDAVFGQKTPVYLADAATRSFSIRVTQVVFADNTAWTDTQKLWEPLMEQETLETVLENEELVEQYRIQFGLDACYQMIVERGLWRCTCGGVNHQGELACHICGKEFDKLLSATIPRLTAARNERLVFEKREAAEQRAKSVKVLKIAIPVVILLAVAIGVIGWMRGKDRNQPTVANKTPAVTAAPTMKTPYEQTPRPTEEISNLELLPGSDIRYVTESDLASLTWEELCFARNEIFARHGRIFATDEIAQYFEQKAWYHGVIQPEEFREDILNSIEKANIQFIIDYERQHYGGSYY